MYYFFLGYLLHFMPNVIHLWVKFIFNSVSIFIRLKINSHTNEIQIYIQILHLTRTKRTRNSQTTKYINGKLFVWFGWQQNEDWNNEMVIKGDGYRCVLVSVPHIQYLCVVFFFSSRLYFVCVSVLFIETENSNKKKKNREPATMTRQIAPISNYLHCFHCHSNNSILIKWAYDVRINNVQIFTWV